MRACDALLLSDRFEISSSAGAEAAAVLAGWMVVVGSAAQWAAKCERASLAAASLSVVGSNIVPRTETCAAWRRRRQQIATARRIAVVKVPM